MHRATGSRCDPQKNRCERIPSVEVSTLSAGAFLVGNRGFHTEIDFSPFGTRCDVITTAQDSNLAFSPSHFPCVSSRWSLLRTGMAAFTSTIVINAEQLSNSPQLQPAFEHLLRNSNVHESVISTLRINAITDRDTFVHMFDSEAALKDGASDLGFDLTAGGRTSGNLLGLSQVGRQPRSWLKHSSRQMP